jgi:succinoglycan biosynthesis protein ExoA
MGTGPASADSTRADRLTQRISVVVPMRNEITHVDGLVEDLAAQDFDGELEIFVADGGSTDGSRARLEEAAVRLGLDLVVVDNDGGYVAPGLNACIRRASGDLIVRLDCHSRYPSEYLTRCARAADETGAWNVGGIVRAEGCTDVERAIAAAMDSPFGGINWKRGAESGARRETDTVFCGAFRPEVFAQAGLFDETLVRNQDDELNLRIRLAGGSIVFDPAIRATYAPRGSYRALFDQYYGYGRWKVPVMLKHRRIASARSLAPLAFVGSLAGLGLVAPRSGTARKLLAGEVGVYGVCAIGASVAAARARREPIRLAPRVAAAFTIFHTGYGLGMLAGAAAALRRRQTL